MEEITLITTAREKLNTAETAFRDDNYEEYAKHMGRLLYLLLYELVGPVPGKPDMLLPERPKP